MFRSLRLKCLKWKNQFLFRETENSLTRFYKQLLRWWIDLKVRGWEKGSINNDGNYKFILRILREYWKRTVVSNLITHAPCNLKEKCFEKTKKSNTWARQLRLSVKANQSWIWI